MTWPSLVLTYAPLVVALVVPVRGTLVVSKRVLFSALMTVLADHLPPLLQ